MICIQKTKMTIANEKLIEAYLQSFLAKLNDPSISNDALRKTFKVEMPEKEIQWPLEGLLYAAHKIRFGEAHVNHYRFQNKYGNVILGDDIRKVLTDAKESVLNIFGENIVEQLAASHRIRAEKLQYGYEKEQLQSFEALLMQPDSNLTNKQLAEAFKRLEIRPELKDKLYWIIWYANGRPNTSEFGTITFNDNPRCLLQITNNLTKPSSHDEKNTNVLAQMIALLDKESNTSI